MLAFNAAAFCSTFAFKTISKEKSISLSLCSAMRQGITGSKSCEALLPREMGTGGGHMDRVIPNLNRSLRMSLGVGDTIQRSRYQEQFKKGKTGGPSPWVNGPT